MVEPS
jgi:serine/threonine protein kinase